MATNTTYMNLIKPELTDVADIASINTNMDTIDAKLGLIEAGAEVNVNADWNASSGDAQILNKPTIPDAVTVIDNLTSTSTTSALSANQGKVLGELVSNLTQELCIVEVSTIDSQSVVGQTITMTDLTDETKTTTYTLLTGESSHSFRVGITHEYHISVDDKDDYYAPAQSATFTALTDSTRNVTMQYALMPPIGGTLESYSWGEIKKISEAGLANDYFSIGDEKNITLSTSEVMTMKNLRFRP